jgi:uncharacterized protein YecA (UPF0149 family)
MIKQIAASGVLTRDEAYQILDRLGAVDVASDSLARLLYELREAAEAIKLGQTDEQPSFEDRLEMTIETLEPILRALQRIQPLHQISHFLAPETIAFPALPEADGDATDQ